MSTPKHTALYVWLPLLAMLGISGCKKQDPPPPINENELITTVHLTFTEQGSSAAPLVFTYKHLGGDGSEPASQFDRITLKACTTYSMTIHLLDESKNPVVNATEEVEEESDQHLFVYTPTPTSLLAVTITDKDVNNLPVGLEAAVATGTAATGKLKVQLRHQPPVNGQRVKDGTPGPGDDDLNLDFNVTIQ